MKPFRSGRVAGLVVGLCLLAVFVGAASAAMPPLLLPAEPLLTPPETRRAAYDATEAALPRCFVPSAVAARPPPLT